MISRNQSRNQSVVQKSIACPKYLAFVYSVARQNSSFTHITSKKVLSKGRTMSLSEVEAGNPRTTLSNLKGVKVLSLKGLKSVKVNLHTIKNPLKLLPFELDNGVLGINFNKLEIDGNTAKELFVSIVLILDSLKSLNKKGYNNKISNIPVLEKFMEEFNLKDKNVVDLVKNEWSYNLILFNLYLLICLICNISSIALDEDFYSDLKTLQFNIEELLPNSIKIHLRKRGIKLFQNTYVGYDSEYELLSSEGKVNKLLSVQLAGNVIVYVSIPLVNQEFQIAYVNPQTSKVSLKKTEDLGVLESSINRCVKLYRSMMLSDYDKLMNDLVEGFKSENLNFTATRDLITFTFPLSEVKKRIKFTTLYRSNELVKDSELLVKDIVKENAIKLHDLINKIAGRSDVDLKEKYLEAFDKRSSRISYGFGLGGKLSITTARNLYICCHLTTADLSILDDFETFKERLDIVNKCFVTRGRALRSDSWSSNVHIRDTMLLAPGSKKSLAALGNIYGSEFKKIDLGNYRGDMKKLMVENISLFEEYALQDSLITLKHVNEMTDFYFKLGKFGVPLTLSSISIKYVERAWDSNNYGGYQVRPDYNLGQVNGIVTPKGLNALGDVGLNLSYFISSYRGGRNESFMYGVDKSRVWFDYDLTSAYTTGMSGLGHPNYNLLKLLDEESIKALKCVDFVCSYIAIKTDFEFSQNIKYPCIPCSIEDGTTVYPLKGTSVITGLEYMAAKSIGCHFSNSHGVLIPFKKNKKEEGEEEKLAINILGVKNTKISCITKDTVNEGFVDKLSKPERVNLDDVFTLPFKGLIQDLQKERRSHPKGSFLNLMYKEIANSIYGQVAKGISNKKTFDIQSKGMVVIQGGYLSNPILASHITGFIRCVIGESLNNISILKGSVVSVTTDGFITDIENLESKIMALPPENRIFLSIYRKFINELSQGLITDCFELKNTESSGLISWTTRGQLGFKSGVKATTGFQSQGIDRQTMVDEFIKTMNSESKSIDFIQQSLRSANEIYKRGGHVIMSYKDREYKLVYDNRRQIIDNKKSDPSLEMLDSRPWNDASECKTVRSIQRLVNAKEYNKLTTKPSTKSYKSYLEIGVRSFIKGYLQAEPMYGLRESDFNNYQSIIDFIHGYELTSSMRLSKQSISNLRNRKSIINNVPRIKETKGFAEYIKSKLNHFDIDLFFK